MRETSPSSKIIALVPAAGVGARAAMRGQPPLPKQYQLLAGEPMLRHAVKALLQDGRVSEVCVIVAPGDERVIGVLSDLPRTAWYPCGGETRAQTVLNGLARAHLAADDWVLVHDAARPGLPQQALTRLIDACLAGGDGGLLAMPVADTLKRIDPASTGSTTQDSVVQQTVQREGLWLAQTPQMFRAGQLTRALSQSIQLGLSITDEASAMEAAGFRPLLVQGSGRNVKVTWPEDLAWVASWL